MAYRFVRQRVRLKINVDQKDNALEDAITGNPIRFARNAAVQFEVGLFWGGELVDGSNIAAASLTIKPASNRQSAAELHQTIGPESMNRNLTQAEWDAGTSQHFTFVFASTATGIGTGNESSHWLVVHGITDDAALDIDVFGAGACAVFDAGIALATSPSVPAEGGVTLAQIQALLQGYAKLIMDPGQTLTIPNESNTVRRVIGIDDNGVPFDRIESV